MTNLTAEATYTHARNITVGMTVYINASTRHTARRLVGRCIEVTKSGCIKVQVGQPHRKETYTFLATGYERGTRDSWNGGKTIVTKETYDSLGDRSRADAARLAVTNRIKALNEQLGRVSAANRDELLKLAAELTAAIHSL